jgi:formate dehydrogenase iron-sulfur subunit
MTKKALLVTPELCIGCRGCQIACKSWNQLPADKTENHGSYENPPDLTAYNFNKIRFVEAPSEKNPTRWLFVSQRCMHCSDAGCMKICSSPGALTRNEFGAVVTDHDKCVGCHLCVAGCPFNVPRYDKKSNKLQKCTQCADRLPHGLPPLCAKTCPTGAIAFGDRDELIVKARKMGYATVYGKMDLGGLGTLFAFADEPKLYGYDEKPHINEFVIFWHKFLKPASWLGLGGMSALMALHYFAVGPKKEHPEEEKETCLCEQPVPGKEDTEVRP